MSALPWDAPACTCLAVEPELWTTYGSAVEPSSALEYDPECPEHRLDNAAPAPAGTPDQVTMWCEPCRGPQVVVDEFDEQIGHEAHTVNVRVRALDCGHEEVYDRRYPGHPDFDPTDAQLAASGLIVGAP